MLVMSSTESFFFLLGIHFAFKAIQFKFIKRSKNNHDIKNVAYLALKNQCVQKYLSKKTS